MVNNTKNPTYVLNFFNKDYEVSPIPHPKNLVKNEIEQAEQLHLLISVLIHQADEADKLEEKENMKLRQGTVVEKTTSVADEIRKLADLKAEGLLTADEFEKQKNRLMI